MDGRLRLVAAKSRTLTLIVCVLPSRSNSCSCRTRKQFGLQLRWNSAHFVQEQGALVRQVESLGLARDGASERALLVAEQLTFEQSQWNGRTIHFHESVVAPPARIVDGPCDELFARAGFAQNQDGRIRGRYDRHLFQNVFQRRAGADNLLEVLPAANLLVEINTFLGQPLSGFRNLIVVQRIIRRQRHLAGYLTEKNPHRRR